MPIIHDYNLDVLMLSKNRFEQGNCHNLTISYMIPSSYNLKDKPKSALQGFIRMSYLQTTIQSHSQSPSKCFMTTSKDPKQCVSLADVYRTSQGCCGDFQTECADSTKKLTSKSDRHQGLLTTLSIQPAASIIELQSILSTATKAQCL